MAFRQPQEQEQGVPSLGYRLSSNRQPGIEQSNNRMPNQQQQGNPYEGRRFPTPEQYRRGQPAPMPMPSPDREFDFRRNMPLPAPMPSPDYDRSMPMPFPFEREFFPSPNFDPRDYEYFGQEDMGMGGYDMMPMAYVPGDDYGSYIPDSVLGMDEFGGQYDPRDEYEFDYLQGLEAFPNFTPDYKSRGGLMSLRR